MKQSLLITMAAASLAACGTQQTAAPTQPAQPAIGLANPASVYCASLGGKSEIRQAADGGNYSMCHLPDGTVLEEWALFRRDHPGR